MSTQGPDPNLQLLDRHAAAVATVRTFAQAARAERVVVVLDVGEASAPALVEWAAGEPLRLTEGETTHEIPDGVSAGRPLPLADVRPPPPSSLSVDPVAGEFACPVGALANLATGLLSLARALGGRSVATADFATRDPSLPLTIAARPGEPIVLAVADQQFELPDGWPEDG